MIPHIVYRDSGAAELRFPYHGGLVAALEASIPASGRGYDPVTKVWTVWPPYASVAHRLMVQAIGDVEVFNAPRDQTSAPPPDPIRASDRDFATLHLLPSAPPTLVEAAFRCLSKELHPDRGGQHEAMVRLNQAVTALRVRQGVAS